MSSDSPRPRNLIDEEWRKSFHESASRKTVSSIMVSPKKSRSFYSPQSVDDLQIAYGISSIQGQRDTQEDSHKAVEKTKKTDEIPSSDAIPYSFFGVYDGHGGIHAAEYVSENLFKIFSAKAKESEDYTTIIKEAFAQVEKDFMKKAEEENLCDGTTACIAIIKEPKMYIANVGDSELILSRNGKAEVLTEVHNPKRNEKEAKRIEDQGGKVVKGRLGHPRLNPAIFSIAVSRAIGDTFFKSKELTDGKDSGLIAVPYISEIELSEKDEFIVLACDGVFDVMEYQQVRDFVYECLKKTNDPQKASEALVAEALKQGSTDNITAVVVAFKQFKH